MSSYRKVCDTLGVSPRGREVRVPCPAHGGDDKNLRVKEFADGKVGLSCFSHQCSRDAILAGMGLTWRDLLPDNTNWRHGKKVRASKPTRKVSLEDFGDGDVWVEWDLVCSYLYLNEDGEALYEKLRYQPETKHRAAMAAKKRTKSFAFMRKAPNGNVIWGMDGGWHVFLEQKRRWEYCKDEKNHLVDEKPVDGAEWFDGPRRVLFDLPMLLADLREGVKEVWVCEGEPDAVTLRRSLGVSSTTADAGAGQWRREYTEFLAKFASVVIVADRDQAGYKGAIKKRDALLAFDPSPAVRVVVPGEGKDAEEFLSKGGTLEGFVEVDPEVELGVLSTEGLASSDTDSSPSDIDPPGPPLSSSFGNGSTLPTFYFHDLDLAEAFVAANGRNLRYCAKFGCWFAWDGVHWAEDLNGGASYLSQWRPFAREQQSVGELMLEEDEYGKDFLKAVRAQVGRVLGAQGASAVEGLARRIWPVPVNPDELDQQLDYLPVRNGTVDLRTGKLIAADPSHLFTSFVPIEFDAKADCPTWVQFLKDSLDGPEMVDYMRLVVGYWLTGQTREQKFWFVFGPTRSGKGTFVRVVNRLFGKFSVNLMKKHIMKTGLMTSIDEHWARTKGKRFLTIHEVDSRDRWDESLLKVVTGEDEITARRLHENSYDFKPVFKMIAVGNEKPRVRGEDEAFWTRVLPVEFPNSRSAETQDQFLEAKLVAELPGILQWALDGARDWYENGLPSPLAVQEQLGEYKRESDSIGKFIKVCCQHELHLSVAGQELFEAYTKFNNRIGNKYHLNKNEFGKKMKARTDMVYKRVTMGTFLMDYRLRVEEDWDYDAE